MLVFFLFALATCHSIKRTIKLPETGSPIVLDEFKVSISHGSRLSSYDFILPEKRAQSLVNIQITCSNPATVQQSKNGMFHIVFATPIPANQNLEFVILLKLNNLAPTPSKIAQDADQYLELSDTLGLGALIKVDKFIAHVKLPKNTAEFNKNLATQKKNVLTYGSFAKDPVETPLTVRFEANGVGPVATEWKRQVWLRGIEGVIEYSDWTSIKHQGARLGHEFNRLQWMAMSQRNFANAVPVFQVDLPKSASQIFFRDEVGNISTSTVLGSKLLLKPRFPLFGGWSASFHTGFSVPSKSYVLDAQKPWEISNVLKTLVLPLNSALMADLLIESFENKIVLPEGAVVDDVSINFNTSVAYSIEKTYYYFDTFGRNTLVVNLANFTSDSKDKLVIKYHYNKLKTVFKPVMLASLLMLSSVLVAMWTIGETRKTRRKKKQE